MSEVESELLEIVSGGPGGGWSSIALDDAEGYWPPRDSGRLSPRSSLRRAHLEEVAGNVGPVSAYVEVRNEWWVEQDPFLGAALRQWEKKLAYFDNSVYRRQKKTYQIRNQIFNLVGIFFIFQGILLVVVSLLKASNGTAHCGLVWSPLALSLFTAWGTGSGVSSKFIRLRALEISIQDEKQAIKTIKYRIQALQARGRWFRFFNDAKDPKQLTPRTFAKSWSFALLALLAATAIFIVSYFVILC
ncbi:hypothetical protein KC19_9G167600 [Ceratodon purpureus]|uniref:Uncharacterized protein n=1 Tax=Ceratodon purpureus TaxID=3225 RepID=A0A8T0H0Q7_CERPU|nr:hypothetical protein KC19_9G167600 [Ceratodon purpureus]